MARCRVCRGVGWGKVWLPPGMGRDLWCSHPCPECGGSGIEHCCEGLREQPVHLGSPPLRTPTDYDPHNPDEGRREGLREQPSASGNPKSDERPGSFCK
jgi:hypothetical protein